MPEKIEIQVSLDNLTFGDLEKLDQAGRGELGATELVELLDRVVVGDARTLPITAMPDIIRALGEAMTELAEEPGKPEKKD